MRDVSEPTATPLLALLVEDDARLAALTREYLEGHGVAVVTVADGRRGLAEAVTGRFDVVLLDLMLPGKDGLEVCRELRARSDVPVIVLTARGEEADRVMGLELGADDYLAKPYSPRELLARIRAVTRRAKGRAGPALGTVRVAGLLIDPAARSVTLDGREVHLTGYEFALLEALARRAGPDPVARAAHGAGAGQRRGGLRPLHRRPRLAAPAEAGRRSAPAQAHQDGPRLRLRAGRGERVRTAERCGPSGWPRRHRRSLFWRIFFHGLLLIFLVSVAGGVVATAFQEDRWHDATRIARYVAAHVVAMERDPASLSAELRRVRETFAVEATVYGKDGRAPIASSAVPPLAPVLAPGAEEPRGFPGKHAGGRALPLPDGGQVVFVFTGRAPFSGRAPVVLVAVLCVIALASVPLARSIAAPVEQLTRAARALGAGDLTTRARVRARGEVGDLARAFDEMAERLEALVRNEKELLANVSHEVRTPLARMRVALELAAEGDAERARRYLREIGADLDELDRLVDDVLSTARLDLAAGGGGHVRREPVALAAVAKEAAGRFAERWPDRELRVDLGAPLPPVSGDAGLLRRLLENLLDNAAKYSEPDQPVALVAQAEAGAAVLEVRDQGIGIAPEDLPRLFTPFFRTDRSRARGTGGVGLGLALARRIARAHGGDVEAASELGKGTTFRVRIPGA